MTNAPAGSGRKLPPMLIVRSGWMTYYAGSVPGDEYPVGGGSYNEDYTGYEVCNFLDLGGRVRGWSRAPSKKYRSFNLERIDPAASGDSLDQVLVVFAARHPEGGQVVIGWYNNARVHRYYQKETDKRRSLDDEYFGYYFEAATTDAVLLPPAVRALPVPHSSDGMVRSNVFYAYDETGRQRNLRWLEDIADFVAQYHGENLIRPDQTIDPGTAAVITGEENDTSGTGQGRLAAAARRKAIELRAMAVAKQHFAKQQWTTKDHSASQPYDLLATKGDQALFIEVKGTQHGGSHVFLTANEVKWARAHYPRTALVIVTGIEVVENGDEPKGTKGKLHFIQPWLPADEALEPLAYKFQTGLATDT